MFYSHFDDEIKQDVFKEKTTYTNDYKWYTAKKDIVCWLRDRTEKPIKPSAPYVFTDHETYLPWKQGVHIPFNLLLKPKPIVNTNPYDTFEVPEVVLDTEKDDAIKTRPRLYMAPAVSMDDVPDPNVRKLLLQHMYSTDWRKSAEEAALPTTKKPKPTSTVEAGGDRVALKVELLQPLPDGWRNKGKDWDHKQMKACVDPTRTFWVNKDPPVKCGACTNPVKHLVPQETKEEIAELLKHDRLRLAHDMSVPGYAGYKPRLPKGVCLSKIDLPVIHPFVSVTQAITKRYAEDYLPKEGAQE